MRRTAGMTAAALAFSALAAFGGTRAREAFAHPGADARVGVWWHWMGSNVTKEGITADLEYFKRVGVSSATIFGMCDVCTPWAATIPNPPTGKLIAFTPDWWAMVRHACAEANRIGISLGLHNCPGYTSTGGPWVKPSEAMRELVFNVTNAETQISLKPSAMFPVHNDANGKCELPDLPARRTDLVEIATVKGIRVAHIPMGAFTQPNQWELFGLECDKMNPVAVSNHLNHVLGDMKKHLGPYLGHGLDFVLLDSYEAGTPSWTPRMREEFTARRGYDPLPFLPVLGGFEVCDEATARKFKADYDETVRDLYRDVLFTIMHDMLAEAGLKFACEPYTGPFDSRQCSERIDRMMTEFWNNSVPAVGTRSAMADWTGPDGKRHNVFEAEAFTGDPSKSQWCETPWQLKAIGDSAFLIGVNRFVLHSNPLQPWGEGVRPGISMGRWGTHFGRTQVWAEEAKAYFDYLARCQSLLQWGEPLTAALKLPAGVGSISRAASGEKIHFIANVTDEEKALGPGLPKGAWLDPTSGEETAVPATLAPRQSGFLVEGAARPAEAGRTALATFADGWQIDFGGERRLAASGLFDWTKSDDAAIRHFSGRAIYRRAFDCAEPAAVKAVSLGDNCGQMTRVILNGRDLGIVWCAPWSVAVPAGLVKATGNELRLEHVNVWANRLIGDEQEPADCEWKQGMFNDGGYLAKFPDWFDGKTLAKRPSKGRRCFVTWNYFTRDSKPVPSGVLGPVALLRNRTE